MNRRALWKVSVATTPEADDAVAELLRAWSGEAVSSYTDVETGETTVAVYLAERPKQFRAELSSGMRRIRRCGLQTGRAAVSLRRIRREDWAESWKRHFQ